MPQSAAIQSTSGTFTADGYRRAVDDVREAIRRGDIFRRFVACAADNGIDVFRLHDPLNDVSNLSYNFV